MTKESLKKIEMLIPLIETWQLATFPDATPQSAANHLVEEAKEVLDAIETGKGNVGEELADVLHLVIAVADRVGVDLGEELNKKFRVNLARKWDGGRHVEAPKPLTADDIKPGDRVVISGRLATVWQVHNRTPKVAFVYIVLDGESDYRVCYPCDLSKALPHA